MINYPNIESLFMKVVLLCAILSSTFYLLMLGWYNNLLLDDYGFVAYADNGGAFELMKNAYLGWQGRFSAFYTLGWILKVWGHASNLIGYTILMLLLGYTSLYYALSNIIRLSDKWLLCIVSILVTNISIMAYLELSTFYWVCCAICTLSTYAAIVLFTAIFFSKGALWARWLTAIICSLYLCGGAENFTPILIAAFGIIILYQMVYHRDWHLWRDEQMRMVLICLLILCIGFVIGVTASGTQSRAGHLQGFMSHFALIPYCSQLGKASVVFFMRLLSRSLYYMLLLPIGGLVGIYMRKMDSVCRFSIWSAVVLPLLLVVGAILLSIAASVYGMGWYSPLRSYSFVSFLMAGLFLYWGIILGRRSNIHKMSMMAIISALIIAAISISFTKKEQPLVADIHAQIESRHAQIIAHKNSDGVKPIIIEAVKYPYIPNTYAFLRKSLNTIAGVPNKEIAEPVSYFPYERYCLTKDPNDWRNEGLKNWLNVEFDIIGWSEE